MTGNISRNTLKWLCLTLFLILTAAAAVTGCAGQAGPQFRNINAEDLNSIIKNEKDILLVDVREPAELKETGFIPGAVNIPVSKVKEVFGTLPKTGKLIIYCRSGRRSAEVAQFLADKDFANVYNLTGGIIAWPYEKVGH